MGNSPERKHISNSKTYFVLETNYLNFGEQSNLFIWLYFSLLFPLFIPQVLLNIYYVLGPK